MSEAQEAIFVGLVEKSWKKYYETIENKYMDDLLVGAVISSNVEIGYSLIDLESDGVKHYLRFEDLASKERYIFELTNLTEDLVSAKVLGRHARVTIGYGHMVNNVGKVWQMLKSEMKSSFMDSQEPGIITFDADLDTGYVYTQVPLIFELDDYFGEGYRINYTLLQSHIGATVDSLKKYLNGRLS